MVEFLDSARLLIYSHDSFGLGHLRRCRAIAHSLVERYKGLSVLILSGSPLIARFDFRARVDFVRIPGIIKLYNGEYIPLGLHIDIKDTLAIRSSIIRHTAEAFAPDLFLVDKEPMGLKGEVMDTLPVMKDMGVTTVLGLRDIMDEPSLLKKEWDERNVMPVLEDLYDEIWVYGLPQIYDPLMAMDVPASVRDKMIYTGYLPRDIPKNPNLVSPVDVEDPYILVTAGGGGDGEEMIDWVLRAYEYDPSLSYNSLLAFGPFMRPDSQREFQERAAKLVRVKTIVFDSHFEILMARSVGVVAMGGYNTFCEILSFDKPALIIPRTKPRQEQLIRASRAQDLGLVTMLTVTEDRDPRVMADALRALPLQKKPSQSLLPGMLDGFDSIGRLMGRRVEGKLRGRRRTASTRT